MRSIFNFESTSSTEQPRCKDLLPGPQDGPCAGGPEGGDLLGEGGGPQEVEQASGLHLLQDQHLGRDSVQGLEQHCLHVDS